MAKLIKKAGVVIRFTDEEAQFLSTLLLDRTDWSAVGETCAEGIYDALIEAGYEGDNGTVDKWEPS